MKVQSAQYSSNHVAYCKVLIILENSHCIRNCRNYVYCNEYHEYYKLIYSAFSRANFKQRFI